jgi:hypothetical protein
MITQITPRLALVFTAAIPDPRITFSRSAATATRINASGITEVMAADTPRFDFDPVTLACRGLLIEEARENLVQRSEEFENAYWTKTNLTVTLNTAIAPNGLMVADKLVEGTAANALAQVQRVVSSSAIAYTWSVYAKAAERNWLVLNVFNLSSSRAYFNLQTGTLGGVAAGITARIIPVGDGWYRCSITRTTAADANAQWQVGITTANNTPTYTGDGTSGLFIWGAQLEAGAFPTSYIPTTTTAVTRNADVATITGTNFSDFWQAGKGGVLVRARPGTVSGTRPWVQFDDGTADNLIAILGNTTNPELYIVDSTTPQAQIDAGTIAANTDYAMTAWWNTDDCKARLDNGSVFSDTSATIPTVDQMRIGSDGTNYLNGHIASIGYYDRFSSQIYTRRKNKAVFSLL